MSHKTRIERHIIVDLIAGVAAASLVVAILNKSWAAVLLTVASGVALFLLERNNIQDEDQLESDLNYFPGLVEAVDPPFLPNTLSDKDVVILKKKASHPASTDVPSEGLACYIAGLEDGAAVTAQWVLNQLEEAE